MPPTIGHLYFRIVDMREKPYIVNNSGNNEWFTPKRILDVVGIKYYQL